MMIRNAVAMLLLSLTLGGSAPASSGSGRTESGIASRCVHWKAEARFQGLGFNHYVHLHNRCEIVMRCEVKTNVNNTSRTVTLDPNEKHTVKTFTGSPSSEFKTRVSCTRGTPSG